MTSLDVLSKDELVELVKKINSACVNIALQKRECKHRAKECFFAGRLDLALRILLMTGFTTDQLKKYHQDNKTNVTTQE